MMDERKKILQELDQLKSDSGFRLPEGYFNSLSARISDKISSQQNVNQSSGSWVRFLRPQLALVALFTGVAILGYFGLNFFTGNDSTQSFSNENISEYFSYYYPANSHFDYYEYAELNGIDEVFDDDTEENQEIIDYLIFTEVDIQSILNEF